MIYLTSDHAPVPRVVVQNEHKHPTGLAIRQNDTVRLAELGIYPHEPPTDPHPLGITWMLMGDTYIGTPTGTVEEITAALAAQEQARLEAWRATTSCSAVRGELVLEKRGLRDQWIALMTTLSVVDQIRYAREGRWDRSDPMMDKAIQAMVPTLSENERALLLDGMFREATA